MKSLLAKFGITNKQTFTAFISQFIRFGLVGLSNTAISLAIYYLFLWINPALYILGNIIGFIVSVANAFFWANRYVFKGHVQNLWKSLAKTYLAYGSTVLLATGLLFLQVEFWGISKILAPLLNMVITIPLNFIIHKFWVFKK